MAEKILSKSRYMNGLQCIKYLWTAVHEYEKISPPDAGTRQRFDAGNAVGQLARTLFPAGIAIDVNSGFMEGIRQTEALLSKRVPLFEAAIMSGRLYARVDILNPVNYDEWDIIEVKSAASVKSEHISDVAFQRYCLQKAGLKINKCYLMFINTQYVKNGDIDVNSLFVEQDITDSINQESEDMRNRIDSMLAVIDTHRSPEVQIGGSVQ